MSTFNWKEFLTRWSDAILASGEFDEQLTAAAKKKKWAGFAPASEAAITAAEKRLKLKLPPSYREFLKVSNGWWLQGTGGPLRLLPIEKVNLIIKTDPQCVDIWCQFPDGEVEADDFPNSHLRTALQISEDNDGRYLLNPKIKPVRGEWQAAFFAAWVPGFECYDSFQELFQKLGEAFLEAHSDSGKSKGKSKARNLAKPPEEDIEDPKEFFKELRRLAFFKYAPKGADAVVEKAFLRLHQKLEKNGWSLSDNFVAPGSVLFTEDLRRTVTLDEAHLAKGRAAYAVERLCALLNIAGIELGSLDESTDNNQYSATLEGVSHKFFRTRNGHPAVMYGARDDIGARLVLNGMAVLINKVLKNRGCTERISLLEEIGGGMREIDGIQCSRIRHAFVLLNDDLSYLMMWTPLLRYCAPLRGDVF